MDEVEREIGRIEGGGIVWRETDEIVQLEVERPLKTFVSVRLPTAQWLEIRRRASELGVDPTALVQDWIAEKLHPVPTV